MSQFYDKSSLTFIPSGYRDGKLYSQKPLSTDGELSFSRGSDIEATRVNANGYIEKAQVNLLLQSNTYSNATWVKGTGGTGVSVTGGQSGYDGTSDAWLLAKNAAVEAMNQSISTSGVQTLSIYAKAGTLNWLRLGLGGGTFSSAYFDLQNGALGASISNIVTSKIEAIGGGWYRCSVVCNKAVNAIYVYPADGDGDTSGTSGNIYIQDAQLNYGLVAQTYQETTTAAVVSGITDNMPRLNYDPANPTCPSLLLEGSRNNGNDHSEYFGGTGFGIVAATQTPNAATSPEGVNNATSFVGSASKAEHIIYTNGSSTYNGATTISIFAKANGYDYFVLGAGAQSLNKPVLFNIANGTKVGNFTGWSSYGAPIDSDIEDYGNGWYRLSVTFDATSGVNTNMFFGSLPTDSVASGANSSTQNGTDGSYIYGAQIESGSYMTSMIPTYGASATRTSESASKTSATAIIGQTEGTFFVEVDFTDTNADQMYLTISDGTSNNRIHIGFDNTSNWLYLNVRSGGAPQATITQSSPSAGIKKIAVGYKLNDYVLYINGVQVGVDTSALVPACSRLNVGGYFGAGFEYPVKQALLFTSRLPNSDLATLTSL